MKDTITRITVGGPEITATNKSNGFSTQIHKILLSRKKHNQASNYLDIKNLSNVTEVEIYIEGGDKLDIPKEILDRLADYLSKEKLFSKEGFDCSRFSYFLLGYDINSYKRDFNLLEFQEENLEIGDIVSTTKEGNHNKQIDTDAHVMVYIGKGFYISKFGAGYSRLIITTLEQARTLYPFDVINVLKPKKKED